MILIVGLGNPGSKYVKTRHNVGFMVIDALNQRWLIPYNFSEWLFEKRFKAETSQGIRIDKMAVMLVEPQSYMNNSGKAIKKISQYYKINPEDIWVIHDDIDLPLGKIRISVNGGSAGHKGIESIIKELGTKNFVRFRVGIRPEKWTNPARYKSLGGVNPVRDYQGKNKTQNPQTSNGVKKIDTEKFVLQNFTFKESRVVEKVIEKTVETIEMALKEGLKKAMNEFNR